MTKVIFGRLAAVVVAVLVLAAGFYACDMGSGAASVVINRIGRVARPVASPPAGEVDEGTAVALASETAGAEVYFTVDGSAPDTSNVTQKYSGPIPITEAVTVRAIAVKEGLSDSNVLTAVYSVVAAGKTARPSVNPPAGTVASGTVVALASTTEGAVIRYTTNGVTPTGTSPVYVPGESVITITGATTVKAFAVANGKDKSEVTTAEYTVADAAGGPWVEATDIAITLNGGTLSGGGIVKLGVDETAQLGATLVPAGASGGVFWESQKPGVVSVNETGLVTALSQGTAEIWATAEAGGAETWCTVQVAGTTPGLFEGDESEPKDLSSYADKDNLIAKSLAWIKDYSMAESSYTIVLDGDITVESGWTIGTGPVSSSTGNADNNKNLKITLLGLEEVRTVKLEGANKGALFTVYGSAADGGDLPELILGENITLSGNADNDEVNNSALVVVGPSSGSYIGKLTMNEGSRITGNTVTAGSSGGGGVRVFTNSTFVMNGGMIDHNKVTGSNSSGGGVNNAGTFTMNDGNIEYNSAAASFYGGGVNGGTFIMNGGFIRYNTVADSGSYGGCGGGVSAGNFTMNNGEISHNEAGNGGGVYLASTASNQFVMKGGTIKENKARKGGAGFFQYARGTFDKQGGTIGGLVGDGANIGTGNNATSVHAIQINNNETTLKYYYDDTAGTGVALKLESTASSSWTPTGDWSTP